MKLTTSIFVIAGALLASTPALAASDYLLELDGVKGEAIAVDSWSFGACNAGQCTTVSSPRDAASGLATGKTKGRPSAASWDLATNKGARTAGGSPAIATTEGCKKGAYSAGHFSLDCDGPPNLGAAGTLDEVSSLSFTYQKITVEWRGVCKGKHFDKATLRSSSIGDVFEITDATVSCSSGPRQTTGRAAACTADACDLTGPVTMTITGGQMKHTKTGHVTLLK